MDKTLTELKKEIMKNPTAISNEAIALINTIVSGWESLLPSARESIFSFVSELADGTSAANGLFLYSWLLALENKPQYLIKLQDIGMRSETLSIETRYFWLRQCDVKIFKSPQIATKETKINQWKWLRKLTNEYAEILENEYGRSLRKIPYSERNSSYVIVLASQILSKLHSPTMITLDRCKTMIERCNKTVLLINVADGITQVGSTQIWGKFIESYVEEYTEVDRLEWEGCSIPFFQCNPDMPNRDVIDYLLGFIAQRPPAFVVSIGGGDLFTGLVNRLVPVLTVGMSASIPGDDTDYVSIPGELSDEDKAVVNALHIDENKILRSLFTYSIQKKCGEYKRKNYGLYEDDQVLAVVGNRLNEELTDEFWKVMEQIQDPFTKIFLIGEYSDECLKDLELRYPLLAGRVINGGYANDLRGVLKICDLFVNPRRSGGGTSAVISLDAGVPVITLRYGDVYYVAGDDFAAEAIEDYPEIIEQYRNDLAYVKSQKEKALKRASILQDTEGEFCKLIASLEIHISGE
ncbi:MAG: glycosyltransferase [Lachnospiraceae bacterium]|nr:glycosyltransferase [Lachnospiraceae bacterium]